MDITSDVLAALAARIGREVVQHEIAKAERDAARQELAALKAEQQQEES